MKTYYKVVKRLKNGSRVSAFMTKETGLRKTYQANGETLKVDLGMVFRKLEDTEDFYSDFCALEDEIWECVITKETETPPYGINYVASMHKDKVTTIKKALDFVKDKKYKVISQLINYVYITGGITDNLWSGESVTHAEGIVLTKMVKGK